MIVLEYLLLAGALLLLLPCTVLMMQVVSAALPVHINRKPAVTHDLRHIEVCVLVPAHNEAFGIGAALKALLPQLGPRDRVLVVADNCTDSTADVVRDIARQRPASGADHFENLVVVERENSQYRGKGYALDYGVRQLEPSPPDVVLILDSDCALKPGSIQVLAQACLNSGRPVQALDLMLAPEGAPLKTRVAEFAWLVKNKVRPLGYHRAGLPCQLMGTGMAFSWAQISTAQLSNGNLAEDMQLGIELARSGSPPLFCPDALVTSLFPTTAEAVLAQRTRWEHGHLGVMLTELPRQMIGALFSGNRQLLALVLDLCVPPLALLTLLVGLLVLAGGLSAGFSMFERGVAALILGVIEGAMLTVSIALAWWRFGRASISLRQLLAVPLYVMAKVPLYFFFLLKRQVNWVRTKRDGE